MKRLIAAPNLALATLWADQLSGAGMDATVQRHWAGSIAGEIPPDQALPEVWVMDETRHAEALRLLASVQDIDVDGPMRPPRPPVWERVPLAVGDKVFGARTGVLGVLSFLGALITAVGNVMRHPSRFRLMLRLNNC